MSIGYLTVGQSGGYSVFDLLAMVCSMIAPTEEYKVIERWEACSYKNRMEIMDGYRGILDAVEQAVEKQYVILAEKKDIILTELEKVKYAGSDEQFLLALSIAMLLGDFEDYLKKSSCLTGRMSPVIKLDPLNSNYQQTGVEIYPRIRGIIDRKKSIRTRKKRFNGIFENYDCFWSSVASVFHVNHYLWKDTYLQESILQKQKLKIALSPVTNHAVLRKDHIDTPQGNKIRIFGVENETEIMERVIGVLEAIWDQQELYDLILFPEVIGSPGLISRVQIFLEEHPPHDTLILMPTYYENGCNKAVLLGPGGIRLFEQNKVTAFVMHCGEEKQKEDLKFCQEIGLFLIRGVGSLMIPICADLVNPEYEALIEQYSPDIVLCPSYSVGSQAFANALHRGFDEESLRIWLNTCAAEELSPKRNYGFSHVAKIQMPHLADTEKRLYEIYRHCQGKCSRACYFSIDIQVMNRKLKLQNNKFLRPLEEKYGGNADSA